MALAIVLGVVSATCRRGRRRGFRVKGAAAGGLEGGRC